MPARRLSSRSRAGAPPASAIRPAHADAHARLCPAHGTVRPEAQGPRLTKAQVCFLVHILNLSRFLLLFPYLSAGNLLAYDYPSHQFFLLSHLMSYMICPLDF